MKKNVRILMLTFYAIGMLVFSLSSIFRTDLTDFALGFCEGISLVFIFLGFCYMIWCLIHKTNPYDLKN